MTSVYFIRLAEIVDIVLGGPDEDEEPMDGEPHEMPTTAQTSSVLSQMSRCLTSANQDTGFASVFQ